MIAVQHADAGDGRQGVGRSEALDLGRHLALQPFVVVVAERDELALVAMIPLLRAPARPGVRVFVITFTDRSGFPEGACSSSVSGSAWSNTSTHSISPS